eukprot:Skav215452  [mRNA]  locus=scaffold2193:113165:122699:- [translate_table: standard]
MPKAPPASSVAQLRCREFAVRGIPHRGDEFREIRTEFYTMGQASDTWLRTTWAFTTTHHGKRLGVADRRGNVESDRLSTDVGPRLRISAFGPDEACLEEGCSVEALMELDQKLAKDEATIKTTLEDLHSSQAEEYSEEPCCGRCSKQNVIPKRADCLAQQLLGSQWQSASAIAGELVVAVVLFGGGVSLAKESKRHRGRQAVKTLKAEGDLVAQIMRAAAVAFGGGRKGDYPKVGPVGPPLDPSELVGSGWFLA